MYENTLKKLSTMYFQVMFLKKSDFLQDPLINIEFCVAKPNPSY